MTEQSAAGADPVDDDGHGVDHDALSPGTAPDQHPDGAGGTLDDPAEDPADDELEGFDEPAAIDLGDGQAAPAEPFVPTGEPRVDDAIARLADLDGSPTGEHVGVLEDVHRRLHEALSDLGTER